MYNYIIFIYKWQYLWNSLLGEDNISYLKLVSNPFDLINICSIQFYLTEFGHLKWSRVSSLDVTIARGCHK